MFEERYQLKDITKVNEQELHEFFTDMKNGTIKRFDGGIYKSPVDYVKSLKHFGTGGKK